MSSLILVTGGTGTLGRRVVPRLLAAGQGVRVLSRHAHQPADGPTHKPADSRTRETADGRAHKPADGRAREPAGGRAREPAGGAEYVTGDLLQNEGIEAAVAGAGVIVHCAGGRKDDDVATRNLVAAASQAGKPHLVFISVVGADRIPVVSATDRAMFGYFGFKLAAERVVAGSGLPWTTLRATQFHDLSLMVAEQLARLPAIPVPAGVRFQPVDTDEVAARLVELALGAPAGLVPDLAGPEVTSMAGLLRGYLRARHKRRLLVPVWLPGKAAAAVRAGANLAPGQAVGRRTWAQFLAERVPANA